MPRGGKRAGAGRPKNPEKACSANMKRLWVPLEFEPLIREARKVHSGEADDWTVLLSFVLLGKLIGFPEERVMRFGRSFKMEGIRRIDNQIKGLRSAASLGRSLHPRIEKRIAELEEARELFKGAFPDVDSDILADYY